jgi:hypothetical protein
MEANQNRRLIQKMKSLQFCERVFLKRPNPYKKNKKKQRFPVLFTNPAHLNAGLRYSNIETTINERWMPHPQSHQRKSL